MLYIHTNDENLVSFTQPERQIVIFGVERILLASLIQSLSENSALGSFMFKLFIIRNTIFCLNILKHVLISKCMLICSALPFCPTVVRIFVMRENENCTGVTKSCK